MPSKRGMPWNPPFFIPHALPAFQVGASPTADDWRLQAGRGAPGAARPPTSHPFFAARYFQSAKIESGYILKNHNSLNINELDKLILLGRN